LTRLKLLAVLAHPDDESLGFGGTLATYAAQGVEVYLLTATRGERGWPDSARPYPGLQALGALRAAELQAAAQILGLRQVALLDYIDGDLDRADPTEATAAIAAHVRRVQPHVVITFGPDGAYGHPDHIAISQFTTAALFRAADPSDAALGTFAPHQVAKLYYLAGTKAFMAIYQEAFGDIVMEVDGCVRRPVGWEEWAITTRIDTIDSWRTVWQAVACHRTQLPSYDALQHLPEEYRRNLWASQTYYRAFSLVNGGRMVEDDLFVGLRGERS
jgi:LmbE family N-acetylglucosaminyl deacetylase